MSDAGPRVLVVSASDRRFYSLLRGMLDTLRPWLDRARPELAIFDIGMTPAQLESLRALPAIVAQPKPHLGVDPTQHDLPLLSFLARPFLREDFPGYDLYVWIDSDLWFQRADVLEDYLAGACERGFAITHESERGYRFQPYLLPWTAKHFLLGYGAAMGTWLLSRRHLNAGFFAARADAPHWDEWLRRYRAAIARTGRLVPHDQFALVQALHARTADGRHLATAFLDPGCNWIVDRGVPMWNDTVEAFCKPYPPYEPISVLHLAGPGKQGIYRVGRTRGGSFTTRILPGACPGRPVLTPVEATSIGVMPAAAA